MHPEYPCAHCISESSSASVLSAFFGDAVPTVRMTTPTAPGVTRSFSRLSDIVTEVVNARVYDGACTTGHRAKSARRWVARSVTYVMQKLPQADALVGASVPALAYVMAYQRTQKGDRQ